MIELQFKSQLNCKTQFDLLPTLIDHLLVLSKVCSDEGKSISRGILESVDVAGNTKVWFLLQITYQKISGVAKTKSVTTAQKRGRTKVFKIFGGL